MTRNNADLLGISYIFTDTHPTLHELEAHSSVVGDVIGYLAWRKTGGEIADVSVDEPYRRRGIATGMFNHAKSLRGVARIKHSPAKTPEGILWAKSVGD